MIQLNSKPCHLYPNIITLIQFHKNITFKLQTIPILDFFILKGIPASILYNPFPHSSKSNLFKRKIRLHHSRLNPLLFIALNVQSKLLILACKSYLICSWLFLWMRVLLRAISLTTHQPCWLLSSSHNGQFSSEVGLFSIMILSVWTGDYTTLDLF